MNRDRKITAADIDQFRAGLLDHDPALKNDIRYVLDNDERLAEEYQRWHQITEQMDSSKEDAVRLRNQLRLRRRQVLSGSVSKKSRRFTLPQMAFATIASVALTLSMVLWLNDPPGANLASVTSTSSVQVTQSLNAELTHKVDFDLTSNVDFFVWLDSQPRLFTETSRKGT